MPVPPVVLTIAGLDPSSGAGITADIKTIAAHGCYGTCCVAALTVQSTLGVKKVVAVDAALVRETLECLAADLPPVSIHIGMLGSGAVADAVAGFLENLITDCKTTGKRSPQVVLDPILRSSSGANLLDAAGGEVLRRRLLPLASVVTPNLDEAAILSGIQIRQVAHMREAALRIHHLGARAVIVKGGHLDSGEIVDLLSIARQDDWLPILPVAISPLGNLPPASVATSPEQCEFARPRVESHSTHGTGCAFATSLACNLALGRKLDEAVAAAGTYVATAIARAYPLGSGHGPMHHLFRLDDH